VYQIRDCQIFVGLILGVAAAPARKLRPSRPQCGGICAADGAWRFIVSGDSRNCGDVVMPTIAAHSAQFAPSFYWHLGRSAGDLAKLMKTWRSQRRTTARCWPATLIRDAPGPISLRTRLLLSAACVLRWHWQSRSHPAQNGGGFQAQFYDWLDQPAIQRQRLKDQEPGQPEPYYHWIQGGVDFIYLDNAANFFSEEQISWLAHRLDSAKSNSEVKSVVVGMHESLPDSIGNAHSMGDNQTELRARPSGERPTRRCWRSATKAISRCTCWAATRIFIWKIFSIRPS